MTVDPAISAGPLSFEITVDGSALDSAIEVEAVRVWHAVNDIPQAEVVMRSGGARRGADFAVSNKATFLPGNGITISAGYRGKNAPIFAGVIAGHGLSLDSDRGPVLVVQAVDPAVVLTLGRNSAIYENLSDSDLAEQLIAGAGLAADTVATGDTHEQLVQYNSTDWDFLLARARANGHLVIADGGTVRTGPPDTAAEPPLVVSYGGSLIDFDLELDSLSQLSVSAVRARGWDVADQEIVEQGAKRPRFDEAGNVSSKRLAGVFDVDPFVIQTGAPAAKAALATRAGASVQSSLLAKIQGTVTFPGHSSAKVGTMIQLDGLSARFNGDVFISGVRHLIEAGEWTTTCDLGMPADWLGDQPELAAPDALPPTQGLQTGVVRRIDQDPTGQFRVQVELPLVDTDDHLVWVRLATFYATAGVGGAVFFPEVDDEVVVGFMNDDPAHGVILGSLYSSSRPPKYEPDDSNHVKSIVTRSGLELRFDDDAQSVDLTTPAGNRIVIDDDDETVRIEDQNGNSISLTNDGITLDSSGDISIEAAGSISVSAGTNIEIEAGAQATVEGSTGAELSTSGIAVVKGSLVQIN